MVHISSTENATTENATTTSCLNIKNAISSAIVTQYFNLEDSQLLKLIYHFHSDGETTEIQSYDVNDNYLGSQMAHATYHGCSVELEEEILDSVNNKYISLNHTLYLNDDNNLVVDLRDPETLNLINTINARKLLKQPTLKSELDNEGSLKHRDKCVWDSKVPQGGCGMDKLGVQLECVYPSPDGKDTNWQPDEKGYPNKMQYVSDKDGGRNGTCLCPLVYQYEGQENIAAGCKWGDQYAGGPGIEKTCIYGDAPKDSPFADKACKCPDDWWDPGTGPKPFGVHWTGDPLDPAPKDNESYPPKKLLTCDGYPGVCHFKYSNTGQSHNGTCGELLPSSLLRMGSPSLPNQGEWKVYCERGGCGSDHQGTKYRCIPDSSDPNEPRKGKCSCPDGCKWHNPATEKPYCIKNGTKSTKCDKQPEADNVIITGGPGRVYPPSPTPTPTPSI